MTRFVEQPIPYPAANDYRAVRPVGATGRSCGVASGRWRPDATGRTKAPDVRPGPVVWRKRELRGVGLL